MNQYRPAIKQGIIFFVVSTILFLGIYAFDRLFFAKPAGWIVMLVAFALALPIVFMILGARDTKPNFKPFTFGNAFMAAFTTALVATILTILFNILFFTVIDPAFQADIAEAAMESTEEFMENMGAPQEEIDKAMEQAEARSENQTGIWPQTLQQLKFLIWYAVLALISGAVQKDKKEEDFA